MKLDLYGFNGKKTFEIPSFPVKISVRNLCGDETALITYSDGRTMYYDSSDAKRIEDEEDGSYMLCARDSINAFMMFPQTHPYDPDDMSDRRLEYFIFGKYEARDRHISEMDAAIHFLRIQQPHAQMAAKRYVRLLEDTGADHTVEEMRMMLPYGMNLPFGGRICITLSENRRQTVGYVDVYPVNEEGRVLRGVNLQHMPFWGMERADDKVREVTEDWLSMDHARLYADAVNGNPASKQNNRASAA